MNWKIFAKPCFFIRCIVEKLHSQLTELKGIMTVISYGLLRRLF